MSTQKEERISLERIDGFIEYLAGKGRGLSSRQCCRRILMELYEYLPEDKCIGEGTGPGWKAWREG